MRVNERNMAIPASGVEETIIEFGVVDEDEETCFAISCKNFGKAEDAFEKWKALPISAIATSGISLCFKK